MRAFGAEAPQADLPADPEDRLVASGDSYQTRPDVAYDPTSGRYLIVWTDDTDPGSVRGKFMTREGLLSTGELILGSSQVGMPYWPMLASNLTDGGYMLLWSEPNGNIIQQPYFALAAYNLYALPLDSAGAPLATPTLITDQLTFYPVPSPGYGIAYNNTANEYLVAWQQPPGIVIGNIAHPHRVVGRKLSASGALAGDQTVFMIGSVGSIALAYSSESNEYLFTFDRYSSLWLYDLYGQRRQADTLAQLGATFNLYGMLSFGDQNNVGIAYSPETDRYLLTFEDSPTPHPQYFPDLYGRFVQAGTGTFPGYRITIITSEDPVYRGGLAYSTVDGTFLSTAWDPLGRLRARFISDGGSPVGDPFLMTQLGGVHPNLAARLDGQESERRWLATWDTLGDIYARFPAPTVVTTPLGLTPSGWTMALSLRPTLRWNTVPGAEIYRFHIHRSTDSRGIGEQLVVGGVVAENSRDPSDPSTHLVKLDRDLTTGLSLSTAGYWWFVEALGQTGDVLATSEWVSFQIPPLGTWEAVRAAFPGLDAANPYWNAYDDVIYRWSEARDIPPDLMKAIVVGETASKLMAIEHLIPVGLPPVRDELPASFPPARAYLYEPVLDWMAFDSSEDEDCPVGQNCAAWRNTLLIPAIWNVRQPGNPPAVCTAGQTIEACAAEAASRGTPYPYDDARGGFEFFAPFRISDFYNEFGRAYSYLAALHTVSDLALNIDQNYQTGGPAYAQYRAAASYGLGQVVFLSGAAKRLGNSVGEVVAPEALYGPDLNLRVASRILAHLRCVRKAKTARYLGAEDTALSLWEFVVGQYGRGAVKAASVETYYALSHPVSLTDIDVQVLREEPPDQPPDQVFESDNITACADPSPSASLGGTLAFVSLSRQGEGEEQELARAVADLNGDGSDELMIASATLPTQAEPFQIGVFRIFHDETPSETAFELRTTGPVEPIAFVRVHRILDLGLPVVQVDWLAGAHGSETFFVRAGGSGYELIPIESPDDFDGDGGVASSAGNTAMEPDGSIIIFHRGNRALSETLGDVYAFDGSGYAFDRQFTMDTTVLDTSPPASYLLISPEPNDAGWLRPPSTIHLTADDDSDIRRMTLNWANFDRSDSKNVITPLTDYAVELGEGTWSVSYSSSDVYGNTEEGRDQTLVVDGTAPTSTHRLDGTLISDGIYSPLVFVTLEATDPDLVDTSPGSGVAQIEYSLDAGALWFDYVAFLPFADNGPHEVLYRSVDVAGNVEPERRVAFEIVDDQTPPTVSVSADPYILRPPNHRLVPVTITIEAADLESGLQAIAVSVVDEYDQHEPPIAPIELAGDESWVLQLVVELLSDRLGSDLDGRTYDILVQVQDMAGNITLATATVRVPHDQRR